MKLPLVLPKPGPGTTMTVGGGGYADKTNATNRMKWRNQLPTGPGWYWIGWENQDGTIRNDGAFNVYHNDLRLMVREGEDVSPLTDYQGYLFSGPIGEPEGIEE